jgi:hypothetical protein
VQQKKKIKNNPMQNSKVGKARNEQKIGKHTQNKKKGDFGEILYTPLKII